MGAFFVYSLKSSICLAAFYLFYKLLLSRDTFHRFNRIALLGTLVLSVILPVVAISFTSVQSLGIITEILPEQFEIVIPTIIPAIPAPNRFLSIILLLYLTGCSVCFIRALWDLFRLLRLIRKGEHIELDNHIRLTIHADHRITPFSWMKHIVVSRIDMNEAGDSILLHEQAHIMQNHTLDLLLAELCIVFQWYNPAAWLFYRELQHIHEYEADESVINQGFNVKQYQLLLIKKAVGTRLFSMANSLNQSNLKKRITMMLQKKSNPYARLKYMYVLPLAAICLIVFACREVSSLSDEISNAKVSDLVEIEKSISDSPVFDFKVVEEQPTFPGGDKALMEYIISNIYYPVIAQENGIQGRVSCQLIVEKDGSISNVEIVKGVDPSLDREALRVLGSMPKWTPGKDKGEIVRVKYNIPVSFRLTSNGQSDTLSAPSSSNSPVLVRELANTPRSIAGEDILTLVDQMPTFPGGDQALTDYLISNINYPVIAQENGIQGRVSCTFIVDIDGSIFNVEILQGVDPSLDREAIRMIRAMPKWIPGKNKGEIVKVRYNLPIIFRLHN